MVIKVKPFLMKCNDCSWSKVIVPAGDVFLGNNAPPEFCPICKSKNLHKEGGGLFTFFLFKVKSF